MYLVCFVDFCCFLFGFEYVFAVFKVSLQGASVWLPAALRRPQKKHAPGFLEHVPCVFCRFCCFWCLECHLVAICWFWAKCFDNWSLHVGPYKGVKVPNI